MPDAGVPLYKVQDPNEAKYIVNVRVRRHEAEETQKKSIEKLDKKLLKVDNWREKRRLYSGDKTALMSQINILDEADVENLKRQLDKEIKDSQKDVRHKNQKNSRREFRTDRLKSMIEKQEVGNAAADEMDEQEKKNLEEQKQLFTQIFKADQEIHQPIILKAPSSGALETVLKEVNKIIMTTDRISIIDSGVGPITEADITVAEQAGAHIFGFNVPVSDVAERRAGATGIVSRTYKLIFKMTEDIQNLVDDMKSIGNEGGALEEVGYAVIQQVFSIKQKGAPNLVVAGLSVKSGTISRTVS